MKINQNRVLLGAFTATLRDVRLDGCPDVNASLTCMTSSVTDVSQGFELSALDNGLLPFTGL